MRQGFLNSETSLQSLNKDTFRDANISIEYTYFAGSLFISAPLISSQLNLKLINIYWRSGIRQALPNILSFLEYSMKRIGRNAIKEKKMLLEKTGYKMTIQRQLIFTKKQTLVE